MKITSSILVLFLVGYLNVCAQDFQVPQKYKFEVKEDYALAEDQIKEAITWALNTPLPENDVRADYKRKDVNAYLLAWTMGAPNVSVNIDGDVVPFYKDGNLMLAFIYGAVEYSFENNYSKDAIQQNLAGVETAITFYQKNISVIGKNKEIEKLIKMQKKGKLKEYIRKKTK